MKKVLSISVIILTAIVILLVISAFFSQAVFINHTGTDRTGTDESIRLAFEYIGEQGPGWKSLVLSSSMESDLNKDTLWKYWMDLEEWSKWQGELVTSANWLAKPLWKIGGQFEQELNFGFPVGRGKELEIIGEFREGNRAAWWKNKGGIRTYHIWLFEDLPNGRSRVTHTLVFHGPLVGLTKIFYGGAWFSKIERSVEGLLEYVRTQTP